MDIHDPHKGPDIRDTHPKKEHNDMGPEIPTSREQTETCENITFPQLRLRAVKSICLLIDIQYAWWYVHQLYEMISPTLVTPNTLEHVYKLGR